MAYAYKRRITIDHTKCGAGNSTDFPLCFAGTYTWLKTSANGGDLANSSGYDLNFYSDEALTTPLKYERELHTLTTGAVVFWVKIPTLSSSTDTVIYLGYGDSGVTTDQSDKTNVWKTGFKAVYHLAEARSTSAGAYKDSTSNANNGTLTDADSDCVSAAVKLGNGMDFSGDAADRIAVADHTSLDLTGDFTITGWFQINSTPVAGNFYGFIGKGDGAVPHNYLVVADNGYVSSGLGLVFAVYNSAGSVCSAKVTISASTLYHFTAKWVAATGVASIAINNGTPVSSSASGYTANSNASTLNLGHWAETTASYGFDGLLDEVRIHSGALDANWITAQYNNENDPSTFYAVVPVYSGSVAVTLGAVTCAATGTHETGATYNGSVAATLDAVTCAAAGSLTIDGTVAATVSAVTCEATGSISVSGSVAATVGPVVSTATGTLATSGSVAATVESATCAAAGTLACSGTVDVALDPVTCVATGGLSLSGTLASTLDPIACEATGSVAVSGSIAATIGPVTSDATGTLAITGTCTTTISEITCAAIGTHTEAGTYSGAVNATLGPVTCVATGTITINGSSAAQVTAATCEANGSLAITGTCTTTIGAVSCVASGTHNTGEGYSGTVAVAIGEVQCQASGFIYIWL